MEMTIGLVGPLAVAIVSGILSGIGAVWRWKKDRPDIVMQRMERSATYTDTQLETAREELRRSEAELDVVREQLGRLTQEMVEFRVAHLRLIEDCEKYIADARAARMQLDESRKELELLRRSMNP